LVAVIGPELPQLPDTVSDEPAGAVNPESSV
jgi:hypothetical protein